MEEVMKRQISNAITCMAIMAFAGIGLLAYGQSPTQPCPVTQTVEQTVVQPVVVQQPVEQTGTQPTVIQTVQDFVVQPQVTQQPVACADLCELVKSVEKNADELRKYFRRSLRCLECADEAYYDSVKEFERATDRLKKHYRDDCDQCDVTGDVQEVLALANCISQYMDPCSLCPEATEAWTDLQCDLQTLAGQFCTTASFQQPISLACPVPVCAQPAPVVVTPVQPAPVVVQPTCPAPVAQPACPAPGPVIFK
jgi:membrane-bound lytic murein transglycosylase